METQVVEKESENFDKTYFLHEETIQDEQNQSEKSNQPISKIR